MPSELIQVLVAVAASSFLAAIVTAVAQRRHLRGDAAEKLTRAALMLLDPLQVRIKELEDELAHALAEVHELREEVAHLRAGGPFWRRERHTPPPLPPPRRGDDR